MQSVYPRLITLAVCTVTFFGGFAATPDFDSAHRENVTNLQRFVQIDTSNPPGNETKGALFLKPLLDREGIPNEIVERVPGRGNLIARLKGSGKKKPLLLMGHIDVVGVEREKWSVDPFAGVIQGDYLYGRGVSDDKGMTTTCLEVLLLLKRAGIALDRDVIFLAEAGEESSTSVGMNFVVAQHWDKIACEFALNEGGGFRLENGEVKYLSVSPTEKVPRTILLRAKGTSGHGSKPRLDNAIIHLAAAVAKFGPWQPPTRLNETTREYFKRLAIISPSEKAFWYSHIEDPAHTAKIQETLRAQDITRNSMLRTSISPNIIKGGFRNNVIPGDAEATLDVRALPDEDMEAFLSTLRSVIDDPAVEIIPQWGEDARPVTPPSRLDSEMFLALERGQKRMFPKATTLPTMLTGATDSAQLRAKGVQAYGIGSLATEEDANRIHGNDERLSITGLRHFLEFLYGVVVDVAAAK
jgi:acetylornithine deacetylase/succinyl-diaminopimelate desuccinylase-like protein